MSDWDVIKSDLETIENDFRKLTDDMQVWTAPVIQLGANNGQGRLAMQLRLLAIAREFSEIKSMTLDLCDHL